MSAVPPEVGPRGSLFWGAVVIGAGAMAVGAWTAFTRAGAVHPVEFGVYVIGLLIAHDLVVAPITLLLGSRLLATAPRTTRGVVAGVLSATALLAAIALPVVFRWGAQPDNPSMLPRNGVAGLALVLGIVWIVAGVAIARPGRDR